jgi:hypothetical protein
MENKIGNKLLFNRAVSTGMYNSIYLNFEKWRNHEFLKIAVPFSTDEPDADFVP